MDKYVYYNFKFIIAMAVAGLFKLTLLQFAESVSKKISTLRLNLFYNMVASICINFFFFKGLEHETGNIIVNRENTNNFRYAHETVIIPRNLIDE